MSCPSSSSRSPSRFFHLYSGAIGILVGLNGASALDNYCSTVTVEQSALAETKKPIELNLTTYVAPINGAHFKLVLPAENGQAHLSGLAGNVVFEKHDEGDTSKKFVVVDALVRAPSIFLMRPLNSSEHSKHMSYPAQFDFACLEVESRKRAVFSILLSVDDECSVDLAPTHENLVIKALLEDDYNPASVPFANRSAATFYPGFASSDFIVRHQGSFIDKSCSEDPVNNYYLGGVVISEAEMVQLTDMVHPESEVDLTLGKSDVVSMRQLSMSKHSPPLLYKHPSPDTSAVKVVQSVSQLPVSEQKIKDVIKAAAHKSSSEPREPASKTDQHDQPKYADVVEVDVVEVAPTTTTESKSSFNWVLFILVPGLCIGIVAALYCCFFWSRRSRRPYSNTGNNY